MNKFTILISFFIACSSMLIGQTEMSLLALKSVLQSDYYNPALFNEEGLHIGFPSAAYSFFHTGPALKDLISNTAEGPFVNINNVADELSGNNFLASEFRVQAMKLKYTRSDWSLGLEHSIYFSSHLSYPDNLVRLYQQGNQPFIGQSIMIAPQATIYSYSSYAGLLSYHIPWLSIAVRPKILMGSVFGNTQRSSASLSTSDDIYQLSLQTDFQFDNVGILSFDDANFLNYRIGRLNHWKPITKNVGSALDLGVDFKVSSHLNIAISALDIGSIKWKKDITSYISRGTTNYDGREIEDLFMVDQLNIQGALDSLDVIFDLTEQTSEVRFGLPARWFVMAQYSRDNHWNLAVVTQYIKAAEFPFSASIVASGLVQHWCKLGIALGYKFEQPNVGIHAILVSKRWQAFISLDNLLKGINPSSSNNYQMSLGLNLNLARSSN